MVEYSVKQLLNAACRIGRCLLENGGEIYRVESSIGYFLTAYGLGESQIFALPSLILVSARDEDGNRVNQMERITRSGQNMERMMSANALCRYACDNRPSLDYIYSEIDKINGRPRYSEALTVLGFGIASAFFCLFWGGDIFDAMVALIAGFLTRVSLSYLEKVKSNVFFSNVFSSLVIAVLAYIGIRCGFAHNLDKIIIGRIMTLVPGVAITNIMRDIMRGDVITGTTKLAEVLLIAIAIAVGIAMGVAGMSAVFGGVL